MLLNALHHITVQTDDLEGTRDFYRDVLGLTVGFRPDLDFPGYWLYCGDVPVVHLVPRGNAIGGGPSPDTGPFDHFAFLAQTVRTATPKLTVPSPSMAHFRADLSKSPYQDYEEFRADVAATYAAEVAALYELGCRYLQFDDTIFAFLNDPAWRENAKATGLDPEHQHEINVAVINQALAGRPGGLTVTVHMCRGNYRSAWFSSGGYDFVAEAVFSGLQADGYFLEYDDERSGTFEPLRFVPAGKVVVLGLVTTKTPVLESKDDLKRRVEAAARYVDGDQLCLSPQCGFASTVDGNALTLDQQRAKLDLVVQTAAELWGS